MIKVLSQTQPLPPCQEKLRQWVSRLEVEQQVGFQESCLFCLPTGCSCCHPPIPVSEYTGGREAEASKGFCHSLPQARGRS